MFKKILLLCLVTAIAYADGISSRLNIATQDGAVSTYPYKAKFSNGSVVDNGDGTVNIAVGGSGGITPGATYYAQVDPPSQQSGAINVASGTIATFYSTDRIAQTDTISGYSIYGPGASINLYNSDGFSLAEIQEIGAPGDAEILISGSLSINTASTNQFIKTDTTSPYPKLTGIDLYGSTPTWTGQHSFAKQVSYSSGVYVSTSGYTAADEYRNGSYVATSTITWNNGNNQSVTLTANTTFNFIAPSCPLAAGSCIVPLTLAINTGAGSFTGSWPATVLWKGGSTPTVTATASKVDFAVCRYRAITAKYYCDISQNF